MTLLFFLFALIPLILSQNCQIDPANPGVPSGDDYHVDRLETLFTTHYNDVIDVSNTDDPPNILLILSDDMGFNEVHYNLGSDVITPNIDELANNGIILNRFYAQAQCTPTRASLLTGKYPINMGLQHLVITKASNYSIPMDIIMFPQFLRKFKNYQTTLIGKWHLGFNRWDYTPHIRAFDSFYGFYLSSNDYFTHIFDDNNDYYDMRYNFNADYSAVGEYNTYLFGNKTLEYIRNRDKSRPFFIEAAYNAPHAPNQIPPEWNDTYDSSFGSFSEQVNAIMVTVLDDSIGQIINELKLDESVWNNTIVVFLSDHGDSLRRHNYPLRGTKSTLWDGGLRTAGLLGGGYMNKYPSKVLDSVFHVSDIYPTLLDFAGFKADYLQEYLELDGVSQKPNIINENNDLFAVRNETLLNIDPISCSSNELHGGSGDPMCGGIIINDMKLLIGSNQVANCASLGACESATGWFRGFGNPVITRVDCSKYSCNIALTDAPYNGNGVLYNLTDDPCECNNIRSTHSDIYDYLFRRLEYYHTNMKRPLFGGNDPQATNGFRYNDTWTPYGWLNGTCTPFPGLSTKNPTKSVPPTIFTASPSLYPTINTSPPSKYPTNDDSTPPTLQPSANPVVSPTNNPTAALHSGHINTLRNEIEFMIANDAGLLGQIVRLAFHDCVSNTCDGCVNLQTNPDNAGLGIPVNTLDLLFDDSARGYNGLTWSQIMSRADLWALSSIITLEYAAGLANANKRVIPNIPYTYGRTDCDTSPFETAILDFPIAHHGLTETLGFFSETFGFSKRETVALLGAHTLGSAKPGNSGFSGPWVRRLNVLDNAYFEDLAARKLHWIGEIQLSQGNQQFFQFTHGNMSIDFNPMMLNADMALYRHINPDSNGRVITCGSGASQISFEYNETDINNCPLSDSTSFIVDEYAVDNEAWIRDFEIVFHKMINRNEILSIVEDTNAPTSVTTNPTLDGSPSTSPTPKPTQSPITALTQDQYDALYTAVSSLSASDPSDSWIGRTVRLVLTDCISDTCDGCVNITNPANSGLVDIIGKLEKIYNTTSSGYNGEAWNVLMSRADFWALSSSIALTFAADKGAPNSRVLPNITNYYGRKDCNEGYRTESDSKFPNLHKDNEQDDLEGVLAYFNTTFGFGVRETVALMGAHSIGRARPLNLGYSGSWTRRGGFLDNKYYENLADSTKEWTPAIQLSAGNNVRYQFVNGTAQDWSDPMMLNGDISLYYDINVKSDGNVTSCGDGASQVQLTYDGSTNVNSCPNSITSGIVDEFAGNHELWMSEFSRVFSKMIRHGEIDTLTKIGKTFNPTPSPVTQASPSASPVANPTSDPSSNPSSSPSSSPSKTPSISPSGDPTNVPSSDPSSSPSTTPSQDPTSQPTINPSSSPTITPSLDPISSPTVNPTQSPSKNPSSSPSSTPSSNPSVSPNVRPSNNPTSNPSRTPSDEPSSSPSNDPSRSPSSDPSTSPIEAPSNNPTSNPTSDPSVEPSNAPSNDPSVSPSTDPTYEPTPTPTLIDNIIYGTNNYSSYYVGNSPIIILSQHGGYLEPDDIPNRKDGCWNGTDCVYTEDRGCNTTYPRDTARCEIRDIRDAYTQELAKCIRENAILTVNNKDLVPHLVINHLHRNKLDANREVGEAAQGNSDAITTWNEIHYDFMEQAKDAVKEQCNFGLVIDVHGQSRNKYNQLGYRLTSSQIELTDAEIDALTGEASVQHLALNNRHGDSLSEIIRGPFSMGTLLNETFDHIMVPSTLQPSIPNDYYYSGGFGTKIHGSELNNDVVDSLQIEANRDNRWNETLRQVFCEDFSTSLIVFMAYWYELNDCNTDTSAPTIATLDPSSFPSVNPTAFPSQDPFKAPTSNPSGSPSVRPTSNPTSNPTNSPSNNPVMKPTDLPSINPTQNPTQDPVKEPTDFPSKNPSRSPISDPTSNPTADPSGYPTVEPTDFPSRNPVSNPTNSPNSDPTNNPQMSPTVNPSDSPVKEPTDLPSGNPTANPSEDPTIAPTGFPSRNPTENPISDPSSNPTSNPTENPVQAPTGNPTNNPTKNPTSYPTSNPQAHPTENPSNNPTNNPQARPTENPTSYPTINPQARPTNDPTSNPIKSPSTNPTNNPTLNPQASPTDNPTDYPSNHPTSFPTNNPVVTIVGDEPTDFPSNDPIKSPTSNPTLSPTFCTETTPFNIVFSNRGYSQFRLETSCDRLLYLNVRLYSIYEMSGDTATRRGERRFRSRHFSAVGNNFYNTYSGYIDLKYKRRRTTYYDVDIPLVVNRILVKHNSDVYNGEKHNITIDGTDWPWDYGESDTDNYLDITFSINYYDLNMQIENISDNSSYRLKFENGYTIEITKNNPYLTGIDYYSRRRGKEIRLQLFFSQFTELLTFDGIIFYFDVNNINPDYSAPFSLSDNSSISNNTITILSIIAVVLFIAIIASVFIYRRRKKALKLRKQTTNLEWEMNSKNNYSNETQIDTVTPLPKIQPNIEMEATQSTTGNILYAHTPLPSFNAVEMMIENEAHNRFGNNYLSPNNVSKPSTPTASISVSEN